MKRLFDCIVVGVGVLVAGMVAGCGIEPAPTGLAADVAAEATAVAKQIGGANGFGGSLVDGYASHVESHMGFHGLDDLADPDSPITIALHNESDEDGTFHVVYLASQMSSEDQIMDVDISAGTTVTVEIPGSEIIGLGSLTIVGQAAAHMADGREVFNALAVPGFWGSDYHADDTYHYYLRPDTTDLDADGDTEELIAITQALQLHMGPGGAAGHGHMTMGL